MTRARPPLIAPGEALPPPGISNAVPQALMLTAIVISFSLLTFALVLAFRTYQELETVDTDRMRAAEPSPPGAGADATQGGGRLSWLLVCPIVIPLAAAVIGFAGRGSERTQRAVSLVGRPRPVGRGRGPPVDGVARGHRVGPDRAGGRPPTASRWSPIT